MVGSMDIGPWTTTAKLGEGGNATVYRAQRSAGEGEVALKVIKTAKAGREPYKRFVREIEFLRSLEDATGVLPVVDAYLPDRPTPEDRPWLAMPIARPIDTALEGAPLEAVVAAIAEIATTLARLAADHRVGHRDIKPANLYELNGLWLVGDFGLIAAPNLEELARTGRPLGPARYTAYELIIDAANADPHAADVYSLAKTLWVLATAQRFPPDGYQPKDSTSYTIRDMRPQQHARALDLLVDKSTRMAPQDRPTMAQVATDLRVWGELAAEPSAFDLGDLGGQLRAKLRDELARRDQREQLRDLWTAAIVQHTALMHPMHDALRDAHPGIVIDATDDTLTRNIVKSHESLGSTEILFGWQRCTKVPAGPDYNQYALRAGRGIEVDTEGLLIVHAFVDVGDPETSRTDFWWQLESRTAPVGSIQAEQMLGETADEITEQVKHALAVFVQHLP
jgi:serine/threonine protein kinase